MATAAATSPRTATEPVLSVRNLAISYSTRKDDVPAVRDVTFDLRRGETLAIVGESGCGKSTVAFALIGFLGKNGKIVRGSVEFLGQDLTGLDETQLRHIRGNNISMVYQDPTSALNPSLRVGEQLMEILTEHNKECSEKEAYEQCVEMLEHVHMPDPRKMMERYPHQLSGGQRQRVIIGGGLLNRPALLIMDEPTTALDVTIEATVLDLVQEIKEKFNTAVLFITHDLGVVARVADRVAVMYAGEVVEEAPIKELFANPLHPYTRALLACIPRAGAFKRETVLRSIVGVVPPPNALPTGCSFEPRCPYGSGEERSREEHPEFRPINANHSVRCHFAEEIAQGTKAMDERKVHRPATTVAEPGPAVLEAEHLKTYYTQKGRGLLGFGEKSVVKAVEDVDFTLRGGQTLGLVGESGSGKSTVAKTILGLEPITGGRVEFMGLELKGTVGERSQKTLKLLQMVFQSPDATLNPTMKVGSTIARTVAKLTDAPRKDVRRRVVELLDSVKLGDRYYDRLPRQLSGGEKQRVAIARALAGNPNLIVADEPTSALDVSVQAAVLNLLLEIQAQNNTALILITHDLNVVLYLADWIAVMYLGHIVDYGPREAFLKPPHHPYTEALLSAIPLPDPSVDPKKVRLSGTIPSAIDPPKGCVFNTRCPRYIGEICHTDPKIHRLENGQMIACHHDIEYLASVDPVIDFTEVQEPTLTP